MGSRDNFIELVFEPIKKQLEGVVQSQRGVPIFVKNSIDRAVNELVLQIGKDKQEFVERFTEFQAKYGQKVFDLEEDFKTGMTVIGGQVDTLKDRIAELTASMPEKSEPYDDREMRASIDEVRAALNLLVETVGEIEVPKSAELVSEVCDALRSAIEKMEEDARALGAGDSAARFVELSERFNDRVDKLTLSHNKRLEDLATAAKELSDQVEALASVETETFDPAPLVEQISNVSAKCDRLAEQHAEAFEELKSSIPEVPAPPEPFDPSPLVEQIASVAAAAESVREYADSLVSKNAAANGIALEKLSESLEKRIAAFQTLIEEIPAFDAAPLAGSIAEIAQSLGAAIDSVSEGLHGFTKTSLADYSALAERFGERMSLLEKNVLELGKIQSVNPETFSEALDGVKSHVHESVNEAYENVLREAKALIEEVRKAIPELPEPPEPADLGPVMEQIARVASSVESGIDKCQKSSAEALGRHAVEVREIFNANVLQVAEQLESAAEGMKNFEVDVDKRLSLLASNIDQLVKDTAGSIKKVADSIPEIPEPPEPFDPAPLAGQIAAVAQHADERLSKTEAGLREYVDNLGRSIQEGVAKSIESIPHPEPVDLSAVVSSIADVSEAAQNRIAELEKQLDAVSQAAASMVEEVKNSLPKEVDLAPVYVVMAELKTELSNQIAQGIEKASTEFRGLVEDVRKSFGEIVGGLKYVTAEDVREQIKTEMPAPVVMEPQIIEAQLPDYALELVGDGADTKLVLKSDGEVKSEALVPMPSFNYRDIYNVKTRYTTGDSVTCEGSLWLARKDNPGRPGTDTAGWRLVVKRGADGKPGKDAESFKHYDEALEGTRYRPGDTLKHHNRLWMARRSTEALPEGAQTSSSELWNLIGYAL